MHMQGMKEWLELVVSKLINVENSLEKFISAICIACCVVLCPIKHSLKMDKFVIPLLRMLNPQPNIKQRIQMLMDITSPEFRYVALSFASVHYYPHLYRPLVSSAVSRLCREANNSNMKQPVWDILHVIPLYHFMKGKSKPFMLPELNPECIQLHTGNDHELDLEKLKKKVTIGYVYTVYIFLLCIIIIVNAVL